MTRRIFAALLGLTVVLLAGVVVPLGLNSAGHDRQVFTDRTLAAAAGLAAAAEEQLADRSARDRAPGVLDYRPALATADTTAVYGAAGALLLRSGGTVPVRATELAAVLRGSTVERWVRHPGPALLALRPAYSGSRVVGVAAVLRDAHPLLDQVHELWTGLGIAALLAAALAGTLSVALAQWVGRPLRRLERATERLGRGELSVRAPAGGGPPEVLQLAVAFNDMAGRLQALLGSHRALVADVSHQLRTPLAAMRLRLELLQDDVEDPDAALELSGALGEIGRLSRLVDGLLAVARAENTNPAPAVLDAATLVAERAAVWSPLAAERGLSLAVSAPAPVWVSSTPGHLEQVLDNLLANALDATPPGGTVALSVARGPGHEPARLEVADTGPGMTEAQRSRAFRRFWTDAPDAPSLDHGGGSGLGLAIVHRLVTVDGGQISLEDGQDGGLVVRIGLRPAEERPDHGRDADPPARGRRP